MQVNILSHIFLWCLWIVIINVTIWAKKQLEGKEQQPISLPLLPLLNFLSLLI